MLNLKVAMKKIQLVIQASQKRTPNFPNKSEFK